MKDYEIVNLLMEQYDFSKEIAENYLN